MIRLLRWVRRHPGLVAELAAYGFWLLVDLVVAIVGGPLTTAVAAVGVPLVVLLRRRPGARLVPAAAAAIGLSLAISLFSPAQTVLLGTPISAMAFTEQLALAIIVVTVLHRCPLRPALVLTAAAAVAIVGSPIMRMTDSDGEVFSVLSALGWGGAVAIGLVLREVDTRRRAAIEDVRSAERMELARELHDVVAHHVTGIVVAAQAAAVVARTSPDDVDRALTAIEHAGTDALTAMRRMVGVLRGQDTEGARTPGAELAEVRTLVHRFDPDARLVRLHHRPRAGARRAAPGGRRHRLPGGAGSSHQRPPARAGGRDRRGGRPDPRGGPAGVGAQRRRSPAPVSGRAGGSGFGLVGMGERVAALDGTLSAGPTAPGVWTVSVRLPLRGAR